MDGYVVFNLKKTVEQLGEATVKELLSEFSCPLNQELETFIRIKAIEFSKQGLAASHLVYASYKGVPVLVGYFTLSPKIMRVTVRKVNYEWRRRINRFSNERIDGVAIVPATLIGQLGKNFTKGYNKLITGDVLVKLAIDRVREVQMLQGGKFVYLECENTDKLISFYGTHGFLNFGERQLEGDEIDTFSGRTLIQMFRYLD